MKKIQTFLQLSKKIVQIDSELESIVTFFSLYSTGSYPEEIQNQMIQAQKIIESDEFELSSILALKAAINEQLAVRRILKEREEKELKARQARELKAREAKEREAKEQKIQKRAREASEKASEARELARKAEDEARAKSEAKRVSQQQERSSALSRMTKFYTLIHMIGLLLTSLEISADKGWGLFSWSIWVTAMLAYTLLCFEYLGEKFNKNFTEYENERFLGFSKNYSKKDYEDEYLFYYEIIFSGILFFLVFVCTSRGGARVMACLGFVAFLAVRPLRRITHYAAVGCFSGLVLTA
ncbi:MAG: cell envelope integrity protein TolA [Verrucomicrobiota bacterium]